MDDYVVRQYLWFSARPNSIAKQIPHKAGCIPYPASGFATATA